MIALKALLLAKLRTLGQKEQLPNLLGPLFSAYVDCGSIRFIRY